MTTINEEQFGAICSAVWRDRVAVLTSRGLLTEEAALVRAVYWRLCKAGVKPTSSAENYAAWQTILTYQRVVGCLLELNGRPRFDAAPFLKELIERYQDEAGQSC